MQHLSETCHLYCSVVTVGSSEGAGTGSVPERLEARWKPLLALAASTAVLLALLRKLFKS